MLSLPWRIDTRRVCVCVCFLGVCLAGVMEGIGEGKRTVVAHLTALMQIVVTSMRTKNNGRQQPGGF